MGLPSCIMLKSCHNEKMLRLAEESKPRPHGYLQFSGDGVFGRPPAAKFELEKADCDNGLVHIRCCYNNKYWVRLEDKWISSTALKPEEDRVKKSCTLFEPILIDYGNATNPTLRLLHVQSGCYVSLWKERSKPFDSCLYATRGVYDPDSSDVFEVVDVDSLVKLPRYVAFKGENNRYVGVSIIQDKQYLKFLFDDKYVDRVPNEVFTNPDGTVRIKSVYSAKFWARDTEPDLVAPGVTGIKGSDSFSIFKIDDNVIALYNLGNSQFCRRAIQPQQRVDFLGAVGSTIINRSILKVEDLALHRKIYNTKFRFQDARIYNQIVLPVAVGVASNNTDKPANVDVKLSYADTKVSCWKSHTPTLNKLGVKTTIESDIPRIVDELKFQLVGSFRGDYEWPGETKLEVAAQTESVYSIAMQPKSKVTVKLIAKVAAYDIPFTYTQRDSLMTGSYATEDLEEGFFTGTNYYHYRYEAIEEKL